MPSAETSEAPSGAFRIALGALLLGAAILLVVCIWLLPSLLTPDLPSSDLNSIATAQDRVSDRLAQSKLLNEARTLLVQAFGGFFLAVGAGFTWQTLRSNRRQAAHERAASLQQLELSRHAQIADRFTNAIGQLGDEKLAIRLGGVYALERLSRDDPDRYGEVIMAILAAFVRDSGQPTRTGGRWPGVMRLIKPTAEPLEPLRARAPDRQAALTALGRRTFPVGGDGPDRDDGLVLDLAGADLRRADLSGLDLRRARLTGTRLDDASLRGTLLRDAELGSVTFGGALIFGADLQYAKLWGAQLHRVKGLADVKSLLAAQYDSATRWPAGFKPETRGAVRAPLQVISP